MCPLCSETESKGLEVRVGSECVASMTFMQEI